MPPRPSCSSATRQCCKWYFTRPPTSSCSQPTILARKKIPSAGNDDGKTITKLLTHATTEEKGNNPVQNGLGALGLLLPEGSVITWPPSLRPSSPRADTIRRNHLGTAPGSDGIL